MLGNNMGLECSLRRRTDHWRITGSVADPVVDRDAAPLVCATIETGTSNNAKRIYHFILNNNFRTNPLLE